ncbi:sensor histidine kinase [Sagittula sp. S175]|uniref:sensor histidine kinase n=1 Tax=Sagittula sp. S175 TaxID=3415129 RepID=UPI003C79C464
MTGLPGLGIPLVLDARVIREQHDLRMRELKLRVPSLALASVALWVVFGLWQVMLWFVVRMAVYLLFMVVARRLPDRLSGWGLAAFVALTLADSLIYNGMAVWLWYLDHRVLDLFALAIITTAMLSVSWVRAESALLWICDSIAIALSLMAVPVIYYMQGNPLIHAVLAAGIFALVLVYFVMAKFAVWKMRTDIRRAQAGEIERAKSDAVGKLAGGMAHDFNNLLTVVLGNLELAKIAMQPGERTEMLEEAEAAARRGAEMIGQLLAFSRKARLETRLVGIGEMFDGVAPLIGAMLGKKHWVTRAPLPEDLPQVRVDMGKIQSVLLELVLNAREAMPRGGEISLVAQKTDALGRPTVSLSVIDTGVGIAPERLALVCDPFYSTRTKATGLGLSMVKGIAEQSGGSLVLTSIAGQGTRVTLHLPAAVAEQAVASGAPCVGAQGAVAQRVR